MITDLTPLQSYLYQQYSYDDTTQYLTPFFDAYNEISQTNLDTINNLNLPIFWGLSGNLLDWVASSLYGFPRPVLPKGNYKTLGLYNTNKLDKFPYNEEITEPPQTFYETTDDIFKRCLTWNFYKGDGQQFNIQWLKRRVARFLLGGADPDIEETFQISVTFPSAGNVRIGIASGISLGKEGALLNTFELDQKPLNQLTKLNRTIPKELAEILQAAVNAQALQLPLGFNYTVVY